MNNIHWTKAVERPHPPLFIGFLFDGHNRNIVYRTTGLDAGYNHLKKVGDILYVDKQEMSACAELIENNVKEKGLTYYHEYAQRCYNHGASIIRKCSGMKEINREVTADVFFEILDEYFREMTYYSPYLLVTIAVQETLTAKTNEVIRHILNHPDIDMNETMVRALLLRPIRKTSTDLSTESEQKILARIKEKPALAKSLVGLAGSDAISLIKKEAPTLMKSIRDYISRYTWLRVNYYQGEPDSEESVVGRLIRHLNSENLLPHRSTLESRGIHDEDAFAFLEDEDLELIEIVREFLYLRSYRLEIFFHSHYLLRNIWLKASKELGLTPGQLIYLTHREILDGLKSKFGKDVKRLVNNRQEGFQVEKKKGGMIWKRFPPGNSGQEITLPTYVRGQAAYPGKVRGIAKIARTPEDAQQLHPGNILITTMTTPAFGVYVSHAAGIVTNEGGILCHAAIISRENKIPCIVGTDHATKVFHTGDLIEMNAKKRAAEANTINWKKGVRRWSPVLWRYFSMIGHTSPYVRSSLGLRKGLDISKNIGHQTYLAEYEYEDFSNEITRLSSREPGYFSSIADQCCEKCEKLERTAQKIAQSLTGIPGGQDLLKFFKDYHEATLATIPFRYGILILDRILTRRIKESILSSPPGKLEQEDIDNIIVTLISPSKPSFESNFQYEVTKLAAMIKERHVGAHLPGEGKDLVKWINQEYELKKAVERILSEYAWISTSYFTGDPISLETLSEKLLELLKKDDPHHLLKKWSQDEEASRIRRENLIKQLKLKDSILSLLKDAGVYAHLRGYRISICYKADFIIRPLLEKIAEFIGIHYHLLIQMTGHEIINSIKSKRLLIPVKTLLERQNNFECYLVNKNFWVETPYEGVGRIYDRMRPAEKPIIGRIAFKGKVKGIARLIFGKRDLKKLIPGDIIVTPMSTSDLTIAIQENCVGIVTDEGGTMCHAAIISRENRIPCIVGTGNATEQIIDGDLIEMDEIQGKGIVKILQKANPISVSTPGKKEYKGDA